MPITLDTINPRVRETEYAVRGPIVIRAQELERQGKEIIYCNIGNPQSLQQPPLTWIRQVLALCEYPKLCKQAAHFFPDDALQTARHILKESKHGLGAYSESQGMGFVREAVASFIQRRDGIQASASQVYLTDGASKGVQAVLNLLVRDGQDGVMIPIPQYPLYTATLALYGARVVPYCLDEASGWQLNEAMLKESLDTATAQGTRVRAICVINPGNPTGAVLAQDNVEMILRFAKDSGLSVLADEVYQENIYAEGAAFYSFARALSDAGDEEVSLFSFHSTSKGFLGECGHRGGYLELRNVPADVGRQILKLQSVSLCSNLPGQVATYLMVSPPAPGAPSFKIYKEERDRILSNLKERAGLLAQGLNAIEGISCVPVAGAMYAFPRITLPPGTTDAEYCMALLEQTGICVVPGSGFGQAKGTAHFRTTILPPTPQMRRVIQEIAAFQAAFK